MRHSAEFDRHHLWHPYSAIPPSFSPYHVVSAEESYLYLQNGQRLIDGMSSWWSAIHGYNHHQLNQAITQQLDDFSHVMFGGLTHTPAIELGRALLSVVPAGLAHIFYSDSGSVAVEVALKMALQAQMGNNRPEKREIATVLGGYHGDTWHTMSVCDPQTGMHQIYHNRLPKQHFLPRPLTPYHASTLDARDEAHLAAFFAQYAPTTAAFIIEPIVQGAGGMRFYHADYLNRLAAYCKAHEVYLIYDEIATGFGRTGEYFASYHTDTAPDILCLGKALTGGYLSFAATLTTTEIAQAISASQPQAFMHGPTFMANALACSVARASLALLEEYDWQASVKRIEAHFRQTLPAIAVRPEVADVRVLGAIGVIELHEPVNLAKLTPEFVARGIWLRPFGKLVYLMPPYVISNEALDALTQHTLAALIRYFET